MSSPGSDPLFSGGWSSWLVDVTVGDGTVTIPVSFTWTVLSPSSASVAVQPLASNDDAEEKTVDGSMYLTSTDIELGDDLDFNGPQTAAIRFPNVLVPRDSTIVSATVSFVVDETESDATSVVFEGHLTPNAPAFGTATNDITSRPTTSSVPWSAIPPWTTVGATELLPQLAAIVQELVSQGLWSAGNAIALIISGTGTRTAESYDGSAAQSPTLTIDFIPPPNTPPDVMNPGDQTSTEGDSVSLQIVAMDDGELEELQYTASGLPRGLSIDLASGLIAGKVGTPGAGSYTVTVTVDDGDDPVDVIFDWTVFAAPICAGLVQEAETGAQYVGMSGGASPVWSGPDPAHRASYCFTVATPGTYRINTGVYGADSLSDSFDVTVNDLPAAGYTWDVLQNAAYASDYVSDRGGADPVEVVLTAGDHIVDVYGREPDTRIDTITFEEVVP